MAVDPYALCPCGSGKKLKFCCPDIAPDLEKIQTMIDGDQPRAALRHVEQSLARKPGNESLLDLKIGIQMSMEEPDAAADTVEDFLKVAPENPAAYAQKAIVTAMRQGGRAAVVPLQQAIALIEKELPRQVKAAIGVVGHALLSEGNVLAARAHLWLYHGVAGDSDIEALRLLAQIGQVKELPLLLRDHLYMKPAPEGHDAEVDHDRAQWYASSGRWMPAAQALDSLCGLHPDEPTFAYNRGLVYGWLGHTPKFVAGMHDYARLVGPESEDAVEAEALAQLLDPDLRDDPIDVVQAEYAIADEDDLLARVTSDRRAVVYPIDPGQLRDDGSPPPRGMYLLLDKPLPETGVGIDRAAVPAVIAIASHYGRQTDKPERIEVVADRGEPLDTARATLADIGGPSLGDARGEEPIGKTDAAESALSWRWHFPPDTPPEHRRQLLAEQRRESLLSRWPETPRKALAGKSPKEAAGDPELRLALEAAVLLLEQGRSNQNHRETLAELRAQLGLASHEPIDPGDVEPSMLPLGRFARMDLSTISDEDLVQLYRRASMAGAAAVVTQVCRAAIGRPALAEHLPKSEAFSRMIALEEDAVAALELVSEAREAAPEAAAEWDLIELELSVVENQPERAQQLLEHIMTEYRDDPNMARRVFQLMQELGVPMGPAEGGLEAGPGPSPAAQQAAPAASQSEGGIWTPGSDAGGGGEKKLWTPT